MQKKNEVCPLKRIKHVLKDETYPIRDRYQVSWYYFFSLLPAHPVKCLVLECNEVQKQPHSCKRSEPKQNFPRNRMWY
jgi:hypothetical protein